jgi:parallel beta-helix repeat protein
MPPSLAFGLIIALSGILSHSTIGLSASQAASVTVCPQGPPVCNFNSIQAAVDIAGNGDIIKVAAGTYTDLHVRPRNDILTTGVVTQIVYLNKSVTIRGGYTAPNFTDPPNPSVNLTILDVQHQGRGLYIAGALSATLEGVQITGGDAARQGGDPFSPTSDAGGGIYIITATVTLSNNRVFSNTAIEIGGGLLLYRANATLVGNMIQDNTVTGHAALGCCSGGGLIAHSSTVTLIDNVISNNSAQDVGGVSIGFGNVTLVGNTVSGNGGGWNTSGGALLYGAGYDALLVDNTFIGNGGPRCSGLYIWYINATLLSNTFTGNAGGGACLYYVSDAELIRNTFTGNTGYTYDGSGGLKMEYSQAALTGNTITGNTANMGGGVYIFNSASLLTNNVIANNQSAWYGSGLSVSDSSVQLLHNTIVSNTGGDGSGISIQGNSSASFTNTILVSHTVGISVATSSTAALTGILWFSNGTNLAGAGFITATQSIIGDPLFAIDGYHILSGSAAIDAGVNAQVTTDIDPQPRPYQVPDLGADEFWPPDALKQAYLPLLLKSR